MTVETTPRLIGDELRNLLRLAKEADSIELKLTVPELAYRSTAAALGLDPLDAQIRQVFFFDTPELTLNNAGLVARARRIQGKDSDSVVKLRPVEPDQLPADRSQLAELRRRSRCDAGWLRVLRIDEGNTEADRRARLDLRRASRCAACSPRSNDRSSRPTRPMGSPSTTSPCSGRSSSSS